jgi:hypothetical protein
MLWNHPRFDAARRYLYRAERGEIGVCSGCNVRTYRNGLLPDKMGKSKMFMPDATSRAFVKAAQGNKVFSIKLQRGD